MILSMKVISLGFDLDNKIAKDKKAAEETAAKEQEDQDQDQQQQQLPKRSSRKRRNVAAADGKSDSKQATNNSTVENEKELMTGKLPSLIEFLGYAFCPGNCVFGPWIKYEEYLRLFTYPRWVSNTLNLINLNI